MKIKAITLGKRRAYILVFDRDDNIDYTKFHNELVALPDIETWFHYLKSSYVLISRKSATALNEKITNLIPGKRILIVELNLKNYNGIMPQKAWDWLKKYEKELSDSPPPLIP
jgi:hypothetical protein